MNNFQALPIGLVDPPAFPHRLNMDPAAMAQLADSIAARGLISPITVKAVGDRYEVVAGHRRLIAHQQIRALTIDAIIITDDGDAVLGEIKLHENYQREDLSPLEEARSLAAEQANHGYDVAALSRLVRRSEAWVRGRLAILELPDDLGPLVHNRTLAIASALALAKCTDDTHRKHLTNYCINSGASSNTIATWVSQWDLEHQENPEAPPTMPVIPEAGERPTVQLPCWLCRTPTDYTTMPVLRVCPDCHKDFQSGART